MADWKSYADAAAEGIFPTYEDQGRVLGSVNKRLEEMRKEDAERMTLALTSRGCRADRGRPGARAALCRRDADEFAGAPVCGDPDKSKFAECDVQEAGDCPGG